MSREWNPGDVALVRYGEVDQIALVRPRREAFGAVLEFAYVSGGYDMVDDALDGRGGVARPLVVIDPEDRDALDRLAALLVAQDRGYDADSALDLQAALREFADPKPPRPEEPTGLGAVVEDAGDEVWIRNKATVEGLMWRSTGVKGVVRWAHWDHITAVRVLSEGIS